MPGDLVEPAKVGAVGGCSWIRKPAGKMAVATNAPIRIYIEFKIVGRTRFRVYVPTT